MKHVVTFQPAYDKRHPDPRKNYGVHGVHIYFAVIDEERGEGLSFSVATNWHVPAVQRETDALPFNHQFPYLFHKPLAFAVQIHQKVRQHEYQHENQDCSITGGACYITDSATLGKSFLQTLIEGGDEALFARMEQQYRGWCNV